MAEIVARPRGEARSMPPQGWRLWLRWVLASGVGAAIVALVARRVSMLVGGAAGQAMGGIVAEAVTGSMAVGSIMLGIAIAQWLVVLRHVAWGGWLMLASALGGAAGGAAILGVWAAMGDLAGPALAVVAGVVAGLAVFGTVQWLVLRSHVSWAGWWAVGSIVGLGAAFPGVGVVGALPGGESEALLGLGFGVVYGAVSGAVLFRLLRHPM